MLEGLLEVNCLIREQVLHPGLLYFHHALTMDLYKQVTAAS
jgi:hypothetical protein